MKGHIMNTNKLNLIPLSLASLTILAGTILASSIVSADDNSTVDQINITVPMSCTMSGTGMDTHNANINNGTYTPDIGTTTMHVFCNDNAGFAIYAAGYTGDEIGGTNSNKLVGTSSSGNAAIESGLATSAGNPDVSNWAMKLAITQDSGDTSETNAFVIDSAPNVDLPSQAEQSATPASFSEYHVVPNEYTKVAHKNSATDMTNTTGGVKLTTTYAAYISKTQAADTYTGQVIYTLVHPASHAAPGTGIQVTYNSGELQFAGGATTNRVIYTEDCTNAIYIAATPLIAKTSNVDNDGNQSGSYPTGTTLTPITATGADKMKVVIRYGLSGDTMLAVIEGNYDGQSAPGNYEMLQGPATGTATYTFNGDTVTFGMMANSAPTATDGQDYGYFAEVYPIYNTEPAGIDITAICNYTAGDGTYIEPNHFKGTWTMGTNTFTDEADVEAYIGEHAEEVASTGLTVTAGNPYAIVYDGNANTAGTMNGFVTIPDPANPNDASGVNNTVDLMAPNYKKTGYGFAGWSENPNATVNGSDTIYGPNQNINAGTLTYDEDNNKSAVLYAVWVQSNGNMQNFSCSTLNANQVTALTDTRDNNVYTVGKLADGNCWMMENLRLDNTATLSSSNTNNPASGFTSIAASTDEWCTDDNETCINQNKLNTNNTNLGGINASNTPLINGPGLYNGSNVNGGIKGSIGNNYSWYSYGNYYNWYTATAGTGTYAHNQNSGNATGSICPNGWFMPTGGNDGQYIALDIDLGGTGSYQSTVEASNRWRSYPNNFLYSGGWENSVAESRGYSGVYWSSRAVINIFTDRLNIQNDYIEPASDSGAWYKNYGFSVRCLAPGS